ncbi:hypothetical protein PROFUN_14888 [Planoprotostelium fungivorum]|uniref:Uncharacterized protein n=1 Tax=Planoprotostelium fungivorum TaxID=1890364 RepID=A0A2P6MYK3_9EUKA|nr:hypothetical protein PROFUN_14888 [Planoprotostelium fungivorum]
MDSVVQRLRHNQEKLATHEEGQIDEDERPELTSSTSTDRGILSPISLASLAVGVSVGALMCFSNMYFGLQTGWVTMGSLQSTLLGFGIFKLIGMKSPDGLFAQFGPLDNVLLQSTAVATATMPLAGGFVGILPALNMLVEEEDGVKPIRLSFMQMILWSVALCFFGVFFAVPLRRQAILKEKLRFPSGTATAQMIRVLHKLPAPPNEDAGSDRQLGGLKHSCPPPLTHPREMEPLRDEEDEDNFLQQAMGHQEKSREEEEWKTKWKVLGISFGISAGYTLLGYFLPVLKNIPLGTWVGLSVLTSWYWVITPSLSYVGQGMIMGMHTNMSMLAGTITGWAILGPIAKARGWAPSDKIGDWKDGAKGWLLWISLSIMMSEATVSLLVMVGKIIHSAVKSKGEEVHDPAPASQQVSKKVWIIGLVLSTILCIVVVSPIFKLPVWEPLLAVFMALLVSVLAVRALGETDLNPVSGVGKVSQIFFALVSPGQIVPNIVAGAIAEAGAQQAGDLMQDLKTGHLLGASPRAQFIGQMVGSFFSVIFAVAAYELYSRNYQIPGPEFPVPTAGIWLDMARVLNGGHLATNVLPFCVVFGVLGGILPLFELFPFVPERYTKFLPSGIAFAIGMYVTPNWTIPRVVGALIEYFWRRRSSSSHGKYMIILASGFVLGEGVTSIITAILKSLQVPSSKFGCAPGFFALEDVLGGDYSVPWLSDRKGNFCGRATLSSKASKLLGFGVQSCQEQIAPKKMSSDEIQRYVEGSKASRLLGLDGPQSVLELPLKSPKLLNRSTGKATKGNDPGKMNRSLNVCVVGLPTSGKTSLISKLQAFKTPLSVESFDGEPTLDYLEDPSSVDSSSKRTWDMADIFVFVYSVVDLNSFYALPIIFNNIQNSWQTSTIPSVLVANKSETSLSPSSPTTAVDLLNTIDREVHDDLARDLSKHMRCPHIEVSSDTGDGLFSLNQTVVQTFITSQDVAVRTRRSNSKASNSNGPTLSARSDHISRFCPDRETSSSSDATEEMKNLQRKIDTMEIITLRSSRAHLYADTNDELEYFLRLTNQCIRRFNHLCYTLNVMRGRISSPIASPAATLRASKLETKRKSHPVDASKRMAWESLTVKEIEGKLGVTRCAMNKDLKMAGFLKSNGEVEESEKCFRSVNATKLDISVLESLLREKIVQAFDATQWRDDEIKRLVLCQSCVRRWVARRRVFHRVECQKQRTRILQEIIQTEITYIRSMKIVDEDYMERMRCLTVEEEPWFTKEDMKVVFSDIQVILKFHENFLQLLEERWTNWSVFRCVGDIFLSMNDTLHVYSGYVNNSPFSTVRIQELLRDPRYVKWLVNHDMIESQLESLLIQPVQRIPRYVMLLEKLQKYTWKDHPDHEDISLAVKKLMDTATIMNEKKRDAEGARKVFEISKNMTGKVPVLLDAHRRFVREGQLKVYENQRLKLRHVFLFNDRFIVTRERDVSLKSSQALVGSIDGLVRSSSVSYEFDKDIFLSNGFIVDHPDSDTLVNGFEFLNGETGAVFSAESREVKEEWMSALYAASLKQTKLSEWRAETNKRVMQRRSVNAETLNLRGLPFSKRLSKSAHEFN